MPAYFRFLTVMAFNVFLREKVHVFVCSERVAMVSAVLLCCGRWMWPLWRSGLEGHMTQLISYRRSLPPSLPPSLLPHSLFFFLLSLHSNPRVCVITSLGYDHVDVLGETLSKIAWQKGGICKVCPHTL